MATREAEVIAAVRPVEVGSCAQCALLWFDQTSSIRLTPKAVLALFAYIGQNQTTARHPLGASFRCPRCVTTLTLIHDLQRATRFTYWRCPNDFGQLFTFTQFLREKDFIRTPSPEELARLRATVRQIACSQCGAPIDLAADSACRHCGSPIALIDPDGVAKAVRSLSAAVPPDADSAQLSATLRDAQVNAILEAAHLHEREQDHDLLAIGAGAIGTLLAGLIAH